MLLLLLLLSAAAAAAVAPDMSWEASYAHWRKRDAVEMRAWRAAIPPPLPSQPHAALFAALNASQRQERFLTCLNAQVQRFSEGVMDYAPPRLAQVATAARAAMKALNKTVTVAVFWGRERYVSLLWRYLERNLAVNGGIVDKVLLVTKYRNQDEAGKIGAQRIADAALTKYPGIVLQKQMCVNAYGCAFDEFLTDNATVYVKLDDDIIFIKDGSVEHLVLQVLTNADYSFFSGAVVNNPHSYALHKFVGAYPPVTFHWRALSPPAPAYVPYNTSGSFYYGKNMYDSAGSQAHEAFIYNAAHGRLDVYGFGLWNLNECKCGVGQVGLDMCKDGYYRWNINAFGYLREGTLAMGRLMPAFDEPEIGMGWPLVMPPHRVAVVGEALFVHYEFTTQRSSRPDFGLREDVLLPWYHTFTDQYTRAPWGQWAGNVSLLALYEDMAWEHGENRFGTWPETRQSEFDAGTGKRIRHAALP